MSITKRDVLGLYYHVISDELLPHIQNLYSYKTTRLFENDLLYLAKNFNIISYEQLLAYLTRGQKLNPKSLILTFDDGFSECYTIARPLLLKHGIPSVFFITTDFIGNQKMDTRNKISLCIDHLNSLENDALKNVLKSINEIFKKNFVNIGVLKQWLKSLTNLDHSAIDLLCQIFEININRYLATKNPYMSLNDIKNLDNDGFTIGAHSLNHQKFDSLTDMEIEEDITASCKTIISLTGKSQVPFAFPFSADGVSRDLLQDIRGRHDYVGLFFDTNGIKSDRNFIINRICGDSPKSASNEKTNLQEFITKAYIENLALRIPRFSPSDKSDLVY
jgi:peptidoglycan/xylan/chitin deacetylase (PgdA/CDA1 family)